MDMPGNLYIMNNKVLWQHYVNQQLQNEHLNIKDFECHNCDYAAS